MIEIIATLLTIMPLAGLWVTWKLWSWQNFYKSRFLWGLFLASLASDVASVPIAIIAGRRLFLGRDAPPFPNSGEWLGFSLVLLESVFLYLVIRWRDLDRDMRRERKGIEDLTHSVNRPPKERRDMNMEEKAADEVAKNLDDQREI